MGNSSHDFINIISLPDDGENSKNRMNDEITSTDFESLLDELNKQVNNADGSISELMRKKAVIEKGQRDLDERIRTFESERYEYEKKLKEEYQKLNDLKIDFEQEKTRIFNDIQESREELARKNREFEKYRQEQLEVLKESRTALTNNYKQFEKIVASFNSKIDNFN